MPREPWFDDSRDPDFAPPRRTFGLIHLLGAITVFCVGLAIYAQWGKTGLPAAASIIVGTGGVVAWRLRRITAVEVGVLCVISLILAGLALPAVEMPGPDSPTRFRPLSKALNGYKNASGVLPPQVVSPAGQSYSWRLEIARFFGSPLPDVTRPWNHPANATVTQDVGRAFFHCPVDRQASPGETSYVAITGPDTCWSDQGMRPEDIPDGAAHTILIVDSHSTGIVWSEPRDLVADELNWQINGGPLSIRAGHGSYVEYFDGSRRPKGPQHTDALMADGSIRHLPGDMDPEVLNQLVHCRDGKGK
jgi:hypothetical protein